jgi:hypothetical protein
MLRLCASPWSVSAAICTVVALSITPPALPSRKV